MNDTALNNATLELTQKIQLHFPRNLDSAVVQFWNGQPKEILMGKLLEMFGRIPEPPKSEPLPPILRFGGTVTIPARPKRFVVRESYVVNTDPGPHVKIAYVNRDYIAAFGDGIEKPTGEISLNYHILDRPSAFAPATKELHDAGVITKVTPGELFSLMEKQPDGPKGLVGALLTNGHANLLEVEFGAVSRLVLVYWDAGNRGWGVHSNPVSDSSQWLADERVFSRNSRGA